MTAAPVRTAGLAAGAMAGFFGGLFGVGGGVVLVPLLTGRFALTQHQAHGTSLAAIGITALVSLVVYAVYGNVAWVTAVLVGLSSAVSARWGAGLASRVSARSLRRAFALFLLVVAARMLLDPRPAAITIGEAWRIALEVALGLSVGMLAGFMGVGGGILAVPAFTMLLGMSQTLAQGTSLAVILFAAPAGAWEHARRGNVVGRVVPWLALGAVVAAPAASWLVQRLPNAWLSRAFAVFLVANAVWTWTRSGRRSGA